MTLSLIFFFISITSIFLSEVFNYYNRLQLSSFLVFLTPIILFLLIKIEKKKIVVPLKETIVYLIFILFSVISTIFSIDKEVAVRLLLVYLSGYLFFIFSFNYSDNLRKYFKWFLIGISIYSCLIFFTNNVFHLNLFKKESLFYNYGHYQIGNLLVLGIISIFPNSLSLIFFVFILFSYSRSAHIALIITFIIQLFDKNKINKKVVLIGGLIIFISTIFIVLKTNYLHQTKQRLVSGRNIYFSYAISSIKESPLFGIGPGNFIYTVLKHQVNYGDSADQADNIILQVLSENGVLAGTFFIIFVLLIINNHKKSINYYLFLALTLMFMSDLSYCFNFFLILWFILGGLTLKSKKNREVDFFFSIIVFFIIVQILLLSQILLKQGFWKQSLLIYPFQKNAYKVAIEENIKNRNIKEARYYLEKYDRIFGRSIAVFQEISYYKVLREKSKIAVLYERSLWYRVFININTLKNTLYFYQGYYGNLKGSQKMADILKKIKKSYTEKEKITSDFYMLINNFCLKTDIGC